MRHTRTQTHKDWSRTKAITPTEYKTPSTVRLTCGEMMVVCVCVRVLDYIGHWFVLGVPGVFFYPNEEYRWMKK